QLDDRELVRGSLGKRGMELVVHDSEAVQGSTPTRLRPCSVGRPAVRTARPRRQPPGAAVRAAHQHQLVPPRAFEELSRLFVRLGDRQRVLSHRARVRAAAVLAAPPPTPTSSPSCAAIIFFEASERQHRSISPRSSPALTFESLTSIASEPR